MFWTPAFAGVTIQETFYETIKAEDRRKDPHFQIRLSRFPFFNSQSSIIPVVIPHSEFRIPHLFAPLTPPPFLVIVKTS